LEVKVSQSIADNPAWHRASSLAERLLELRQLDGKAPMPVDLELASETLELWRSSSPLDRDSYFADRLAMDGITHDEFTRLLGTSAETLETGAIQPAWVQTLVRLYSSPPPDGAERGRGNWGDISKSQTAGFLNLVEPLMVDGRVRLTARVEAVKRDWPDAPFEAERAVDALFASLPWQLLMLIGRTMVLELNVARLEGVLYGATPAERFNSFTERLCRPSVALRLFLEYPVLARRLVKCVDRWIDFSAEFLRHLSTDWSEITRVFCTDGDPGMLAEASAGAGDTHRRGRSVLIARFTGGLKLVYKPRSMSVDAHFQEFIRWVNERGADPPLRPLTVLNCAGHECETPHSTDLESWLSGQPELRDEPARGDHGWVEFVTAAGCRSASEVGRFYERQGEYLAILYILQATDFHFENLLACGEHPVPVDLEALFHPWVQGVDLAQPDIRIVSLEKARSVLRVGLLPRRTWAHDDYKGLDLSGLGAAEGQLSDRVLQWVEVGTDEMSAVKRPMQMPGAQNRPTIDGAQVDPQNYTESIIRGFSRMYEILRQHRTDLLSDDGPLSQFSKDEVRVVARATRGYAVLLQESVHPDYLRDALDLDRLLDRLWVGVDDSPHLQRLIKPERKDLIEGDIPIFTTTPLSPDVLTSTGEQIAGFFHESGMAMSRAQIEHLSAEDLRRQVWFIRASLATLELEAAEMKWPRYQPEWSSVDRSRGDLRGELIEEAGRIGRHLEDLALFDGADVTWIGFAFANKVWSLDALLEDLYAGSSGVILALAYLGWLGPSRYTELARRALATLKTRLETTGRYIYSIGAFNGWGGIIYTLSHLAALWSDPELISWADKIVDLLPPLIEKDEGLDLVGGSAGCIGGLLSLHRVSRSATALSIAVQCGDRLVARAQPVESGVGWFTSIETAKPITGFSHGAAGISWALLELGALTGNQTYYKTAVEAIAYEDSQYSHEKGNWLENTASEIEQVSGKAEQRPGKAMAPSMAWCYGAPGVGISRVAALKHLDDPMVRPMVRDDIGLAVQATLGRGPGTNHSLCHGDLGNLDFLLQASDATGDRSLALKVDRLTNQILASIKKYGWLCGVPLGVESPALMNGLAGICYGLLRLADPDRVPSVLNLSPPTCLIG
jgi:type 2 lantibiotic biosynthesis protein LanM